MVVKLSAQKIDCNLERASVFCESYKDQSNKPLAAFAFFICSNKHLLRAYSVPGLCQALRTICPWPLEAYSLIRWQAFKINTWVDVNIHLWWVHKGEVHSPLLYDHLKWGNWPSLRRRRMTTAWQRQRSWRGSHSLHPLYTLHILCGLYIRYLT